LRSCSALSPSLFSQSSISSLQLLCFRQVIRVTGAWVSIFESN
jgi:hypothetical protein